MEKYLPSCLPKKFGLLIDMDILVKMFVVNISGERQYIRDICASMEIDGKRVELEGQDGFYAHEVNGVEYEYCFDSSDLLPRDCSHPDQSRNPAPLAARKQGSPVSQVRISGMQRTIW